MIERTILVIDDEKRLAESLAALLREEGYDCDAAVGGREGIEALKRRDYKLVITDLRMPEVDGFQIMDYVSNNLPSTSLIVITGHASTQSAIEAIHQRVADYVTKPFELDFLIASIEKVFAKIEAEEMREDMIRMISHDIKVPLNSIMGFAQFVTDRKTGEVSPKAGEYAEKIMLNGQRILSLLENYLTHARAESGKLEIMHDPVDVRETVNEAVKLLSPEFSRKTIDVEVEFQEFDLPVLGDEHLIFRALSNLLSNAAKYTPEGEIVTLRAYPDKRNGLGRVAVLEVENPGPGISAEERPHVFSKYRRTSSSKGTEGSGLGLFVVQHVSRAHGGFAECESEPNLLTTFRIVLPLEPREEGSGEENS